MFRVRTTMTAAEMIRDIQDGKARAKLRDKVRDLAEAPHMQGKPLTDDLKGFRSVPAAGRFRIVYEVTLGEFEDENRKKWEGDVIVRGAGIRRQGDKHDVYEVVARLHRRGKL